MELSKTAGSCTQFVMGLLGDEIVTDAHRIRTTIDHWHQLDFRQL
jgi:hypothetical protein